MKKTCILIFAVVLLAGCYKKDGNTSKTEVSHGYQRISDTKFMFFIAYSDGTLTERYYTCEDPNDFENATKKILYAHVYSSLNWEAKKNYHEIYLPTKTTLYNENY